MKNFFKDFFSGEQGGRDTDGKTSKKTRYLIIISLVGLLFIIVGNAFSKTDDSSSSEPPDTSPPEEQSTQSSPPQAEKGTSNIGELEHSYEADLKGLLEQIDGVSDVRVMVNLDSTDVKIYERNLVTGKQTTQEEDTNGGTRLVEDHTEDSQTVLVRKGDQEVPLLVQTKKPEVRGFWLSRMELTTLLLSSG
ncbi:Stage III sporulation protein AG [Lentibacillus sp. JNUCC-1]|uniref:stage III sporulation protein AG n=1 Tax=Lentibacillus sp. JNUCC-1 TaxID=2654513 RepID=UPI001329459E|nr:Stage III sporulation protein AG [Lentibacillus sp. JNUCC-1]